MHADLVNYHSSQRDRIRRICEDETTIRPQPAFDATCSAWLGRRVDTIPFGLHRLLSDFLLLQLLRIDAVFGSKFICRYRGAA